MQRFTFAVNRVDDTGTHEHQEGKTISVDAVNEELARSIAREELKAWSPGVQRFHPAEMVNSPVDIVPPLPEAGQVAALAPTPEASQRKAKAERNPALADEGKKGN